MLVYSTCTVTLAENEEQVAWALGTFPCLQLQRQVRRREGRLCLGHQISHGNLSTVGIRGLWVETHQRRIPRQNCSFSNESRSRLPIENFHLLTAFSHAFLLDCCVKMSQSSGGLHLGVYLTCGSRSCYSEFCYQTTFLPPPSPVFF